MNLKPLLVGLRKKVEILEVCLYGLEEGNGLPEHYIIKDLIPIALKPSEYEESEETFTYVQSEMRYTMKAQVRMIPINFRSSTGQWPLNLCTKCSITQCSYTVVLYNTIKVMVSCLVSMKITKPQPVIDNFLLCCLVSNQKILFVR